MCGGGSSVRYWKESGRLSEGLVCAIAHELKEESLSKVLITRAGVGPAGEDEVVEWVVEIVDWNVFYVVANP